ncbi:hypothetical protein COLO4_32870 [Corchorus olitorius]|uniref:Uncharacterized protein n=1 Tax=Corchorus olitorius TaxID=93759 RepID=A0A1R3GXK2_9ROSI|nr:hypothetical protein COLO4_32870 [Corchorus olitorius]
MFFEGTTDSIKAVNLLKPCCWTSVFKKDDQECGLILLYRTGVLEIRSLKTLEIHGYEFAAISILALENNFRIPDSLPCIHDTVLAAAFA